MSRRTGEVVKVYCPRKPGTDLRLPQPILYGANGVSAGDEDALRTKNIVIATPEKLDFALRTDSTLIDDVGLIVLDEGHLHRFHRAGNPV
jgi:superfamily II helicase